MACLQPLSWRVCGPPPCLPRAAFPVLGEGSLERELRLGCGLGNGLEDLDSPRNGPALLGCVWGGGDASTPGSWDGQGGALTSGLCFGVGSP